MLLPQTDLEGAHELAERLRRALARPMATHPGGLVAVTASFGVAAFPTPDLGRASSPPTRRSTGPSGRERTASSPRDAGTIVRAHD